MSVNHHATLTQLSGEVEHITYSDETSGFTIAQIRASGYDEPVTVVGNLAGPTPGTTCEIEGQWTDHPKFGRQFKAIHIKIRPPVTVEGIEKFLGAGPIKGVGPETARRIVHCFKEKTLDIIDNQPERLSEVPGIGAKRIETIKKGWQEQKEVRDVMLFLQSHGVSPAYALKILRHYGQRTIEIVRNNPYRLAQDIFGIGFLIADSIAERIGLAKDAPLRLQAGILYTLQQLADKGHLFYPYEELIEKSRSILKSQRDPIVVGLADLATEKHIVIEDLNDNVEEYRPNHKAVYLNHHYQYEKIIARQIHMLMNAPPFSKDVKPQRAMHWVQKNLHVELAQSQEKAIDMALTSKVLVITGGPGTGKTTIIRSITQLYEHLGGQILLAAPTGRAAKRLSESTDRPAKTLHRLLEYNPSLGGFQKDRHDPLEADLLVIDEASMIDAALMYHLLQAVPVTTTLILVGDVDQLPSVGPGNVLKDMLACQSIPQITLTQIFRQSRDSRIITNAHRINAGQMPFTDLAQPETTTDFYFIVQQDPEKILSTILTLVSERIPKRFGFDPVKEIQVLTPMHKGVIGAENLNQQLQQTLNPQDAYIARGTLRFGLYDKVMQIRNNYDKNVFNGDIGHVSQIDPQDKSVSIYFDERRIQYDFEDMEEVVPAYAISVHKSQGSEYPAVVLPVSTQHYMLLQRNLIYTGITRAKQLVVLVGTKNAMAMAIKNNTPHKRYTRLAHRLNTISTL